MRYILYFLAAVMFFGCGGSSEPKIPKWYIKNYHDNAEYIYGTGEGRKKIEAINSALAFASAKVNVVVKSTFSISKESFSVDKHTKSFKHASDNTQASTKEMEFVDYDVLKLEKKGKNYFALVRIDRKKNAEAMYEKVKYDVEEIKEYENITDGVEILTKYPDMIKRLDKDLEKLYTAKILDPQSGKIQNLIKEVLTLKKKFEKKYRDLTFEIKTDNGRLKQIISEVLSNNAMPVKPGGIKIYASMQKEKKRVSDFYLSILHVDVVLKDKSEYRIKLVCSGKSFDNFRLSENFALRECEKKLDTAFKNILR